MLTRRRRPAEVIIDVLPSRISFVLRDRYYLHCRATVADHQPYNTTRSLPLNCRCARPFETLSLSSAIRSVRSKRVFIKRKKKKRKLVKNSLGRGRFVSMRGYERMEEDRSKGRRKINEARAKFPCRSVRPSVTIVSTSYIWIKNLSKSYEIRKMHIPRHFLNLSGGEPMGIERSSRSWQGSARGCSAGRRVFRGNEIKMRTKCSLPNR